MVASLLHLFAFSPAVVVLVQHVGTDVCAVTDNCFWHIIDRKWVMLPRRNACAATLEGHS